MNATSRTLIFAAVACVSALAAVSAWFVSRPAAIEGYADVGQEFFVDFKDPLKATSLSVTEFNDKTKEPQEFAVRQDDKGLWVIPSHHNYPAEAQERLARTAASLIGVSKTAVQSRSKDDWKLYGVVDPAAEGAATAKERGIRVSLRDASGNALVNLIVGKAVEGRENHYYVREPEKNTTYIAQMKPDLSAKFSDWIEPDLLKVNQADLVSITVDNYSIDEEQGAILEGEKLLFTKEDLKTSGKWSLQGLNAETEKLDEAPVNSVATNLDTLKIVGVRPKPEGLNPDLTVTPEVARNPLLRQVLQADMQRQGFYIANSKDGGVRLVSNEGELLAGTGNGVQYTLYFGEIARGSEKDIEVGFAADSKNDDAAKADKAAGDVKSDPAKEDPKTDDDPASDEAGGPRRYLLVKVGFDESLLGPAPVAPTAPVKPEILNETPAETKNGAAAPADAKPADAKPADAKPADAKPADAKPAEAKPADAKPADAKPADEKPADEKPADAKPADEKPADEKPAEPAAEPKKEDSAPPSGQPTPSADNSCGGTDEPAAAAAQDPPAAASDAAVKSDTPTGDAGAPAAPQNAPETAKPESTTPAAAADNSAVSTPAQNTQPAADAAAIQPAEPPLDPRKEAQAQYDKAMGEYEAQKAAYDRDVKAREDKITQGKKTADELSARFSSWYYVISADSFDKFRIQRKDVVSLKTADDNKPAGDAGSTVPQFNIPGVPQ